MTGLGKTGAEKAEQLASRIPKGPRQTLPELHGKPRHPLPGSERGRRNGQNQSTMPLPRRGLDSAHVRLASIAKAGKTRITVKRQPMHRCPYACALTPVPLRLAKRDTVR